jgi:hypothetical protein
LCFETQKQKSKLSHCFGFCVLREKKIKTFPLFCFCVLKPTKKKNSSKIYQQNKEKNKTPKENTDCMRDESQGVAQGFVLFGLSLPTIGLA